MPSETSTSNAAENPLAVLRRLEWRVRHAVENVITGEYRSAFKGRGMEFDQVVRYEFGDDVRDIDWNVTARLGEPYRKKFVEEREVTVLLVLEDTPSLQFGSTGISKREALLELAGFIMLLGSVNRDRVGFLHLTSEGHTFCPPVRGRSAIMHAAARLLASPAPALSVGSSINAPMGVISKALPKHSILVWLGDFEPGSEPAGWPLLSSRYQLMGFRVDDPWDRTFPDSLSGGGWDPLTGALVDFRPTAANKEAHRVWREQRQSAFHARFPNPLARLVVDAESNRLEALVSFFRRRMAAA